MHLEDYAALGRSALRVSPLALGTMTLDEGFRRQSHENQPDAVLARYLVIHQVFIKLVSWPAKNFSSPLRSPIPTASPISAMPMKRSRRMPSLGPHACRGVTSSSKPARTSTASRLLRQRGQRALHRMLSLMKCHLISRKWMTFSISAMIGSSAPASRRTMPPARRSGPASARPCRKWSRCRRRCRARACPAASRRLQR